MGGGIDLLENIRTPCSTRARRMATRSTWRTVMTGHGPSRETFNSRRATHCWSATDRRNDTRWSVAMAARDAAGSRAACQSSCRPVADGEHVVIEPVDGDGWFGEVHGPDGGGPGPFEDAQRSAIACAPHAAIAGQQVVQLGAGHPGEGLL